MLIHQRGLLAEWNHSRVGGRIRMPTCFTVGVGFSTRREGKKCRGALKGPTLGSDFEVCASGTYRDGGKFNTSTEGCVVCIGCVDSNTLALWTFLTLSGVLQRSFNNAASLSFFKGTFSR